jgi:aminopeptidase-like protein
LIDWERVPSAEEAGAEMHELMHELYPICRSLSGDGVRETLAIVSREAPLELTEVPSGTQIFDWTVPREWNIRAAWLNGPDGERVVDFADSNLHVLGYSVPIQRKVPLAELREHLFTHATEPEWVPFRTSYYSENWGFCLAQRRLETLAEGDYDVYIDSTLEDGSITYGEALLRGESGDEILLTTYVCHPSLANDNLSGIALLAVVGKYLARMGLRYSYRLLFAPATIGPLAWLARHEDDLGRVKAGAVLSCVGDPGTLTYKRSRRSAAEVDQAAAGVVRAAGGTVREWIPWGGDERQFCSPGFDLPVGAFSRTPADQFREYHSSADDLDFVRPGALGDSFLRLLEILDVLETNTTYRNLNPKGEPQLGKRGLYRAVAGGSSEEQALLWALNLSDGLHSLLDISERSELSYEEIRAAANKLVAADLLEPV